MEDLVPKIQSLSTDCHKYRSKKDRKEQKSSFRDILHTIEEGEEFYEKVKINSVEKLEIDSWAQKKQYQAISRVRHFSIRLEPRAANIKKMIEARGVFTQSLPCFAHLYFIFIDVLGLGFWNQYALDRK